MTGLETAIILVAFVITAAAFAFVVLNMGFLTAEKAQSVISSGMSEASSALLVDSGVVGQFNQTGGDQADIDLIKLTFYVKLSQGHEPIDMEVDRNLIAETSQVLVHGIIHHLEDQVVEAAPIIGIADIHSRPGPNGVEPLEYLDVLLGIF